MDIIKRKSYIGRFLKYSTKISPLDNAIMDEDLNFFKQLISENPSLHNVDNDFSSKLEFILKYGDYNIALELIKLGYSRIFSNYSMTEFIRRTIERGSYNDIPIIVEKSPELTSIPIFNTGSEGLTKLPVEQLNELLIALAKNNISHDIKINLLKDIIRFYDNDTLMLFMKYIPLNKEEKSKLLDILALGYLDCEKFREILNRLELPVEETMIKLQGYRPTPICEGYHTYSSKRGKVPPHAVSALGFAPPIVEPKYKILSNFRIDNDCFCLQVDPGIYDDIYLPIIRYGRDPRQGFYGNEIYDPKEIQFTWYYIEPESGIYLHCPRLLVTKNKVAATVFLANFYGNDDLREELYEMIKNELHLRKELMNIPWGQFSELMMASEILNVTDTFDNYFNIVNSESYRNFPSGSFDFLDKFITNFSREHNIQVIALTHEKGFRRMVSECVDNRTRTESFASLFQIMNDK